MDDACGHLEVIFLVFERDVIAKVHRVLLEEPVSLVKVVQIELQLVQVPGRLMPLQLDLLLLVGLSLRRGLRLVAAWLHFFRVGA